MLIRNLPRVVSLLDQLPKDEPVESWRKNVIETILSNDPDPMSPITRARKAFALFKQLDDPTSGVPLLEALLTAHCETAHICSSELRELAAQNWLNPKGVVGNLVLAISCISAARWCAEEGEVVPSMRFVEHTPVIFGELIGRFARLPMHGATLGKHIIGVFTNAVAGYFKMFDDDTARLRALCMMEALENALADDSITTEGAVIIRELVQRATILLPARGQVRMTRHGLAHWPA